MPRDGRGRCNFLGLTGRSYVVPASTNLTQWENVRTNVGAGGPIVFTDGVTNWPHRFHRVRAERGCPQWRGATGVRRRAGNGNQAAGVVAALTGAAAESAEFDLTPLPARVRQNFASGKRSRIMLTRCRSSSGW